LSLKSARKENSVNILGSPVLDLRIGTTKITLLKGNKGGGEGGEEISITPTGILRRSKVSEV
jgi:hypothetical protein